MKYEIVKRPVNKDVYIIRYEEKNNFVPHAKLMSLEEYFSSKPQWDKEDTFIIGCHKNVLMDVVPSYLFHSEALMEWWMDDKNKMYEMTNPKYYFEYTVFDPPVKLNKDGTIADEENNEV